MKRRGLAWILVAFALFGALIAAWPHARTAPAATSEAAARPARPPNIIVINTDDQAASTLTRRVMPNVFDLIVDHGARFRRSIASTPLCCPSRATFLTGQYGHNHGVLWNIPGYADLREPDNTLPVWLRRAGYRTVHIGKYLNLYSWAAPSPAAVAPGWSEWHTMLDPLRYYGFNYAENGRSRVLDPSARNYATSVFNREAVRTIRRFGPSPRPLFMVVDQLAPHRWQGTGRAPGCEAPAPEPAPIDGRLFSHLRLPRPPSFNEPDVSDKPSFIRDRPPLSRGQIEGIRRGFRCGLASLRAVDRGLGQIWRELGAIGEQRNTAIIFTSDNGFYFGEHRINDDKQIPYREALEVPLAMRLPASMSKRTGREGLSVKQLVANVDLPATILDLAGAQPCATAGRCRTLDGRSLLGLARGDGSGYPAGRAFPLELAVGPPHAPPYMSCRYQGVWAGQEIYVPHLSATDASPDCRPTDQAEHYDLRTDPHQLENLFPAPAGSPAALRQAALAARARKLGSCAGIEGRDAPTPGRPFCE